MNHPRVYMPVFESVFRIRRTKFFRQMTIGNSYVAQGVFKGFKSHLFQVDYDAL